MVEQIITKDLIFQNKQDEKLENRMGLQIPEVKPLLSNQSQALQPFYKSTDPETSIYFHKNTQK